MAIYDLSGQVLNWANLISLEVKDEVLTAIGTDGRTYTIATGAPARTLTKIYGALDSGYTAYTVEE